MKKFIKSFLMTAAALMLFAGCNGLIDATVSGDPNKAVITIGIDGVTDITNRSARNIDPSSLEGTTPSGFGKITLQGYSEKGYDFYKNNENVNAEKTLTFTNNTVKINLEYDVWYLTMRAYDSNDKLLLEGRRRVDLKNGAPTSTEPLTFTLSTEGVPTPGYVSIRGKVEDVDDLATKYTAALYDVYTNELVKFEDGTSSKISDELVSTNVGTGTNAKNYGAFAYDPNDDAKSLKPGRYNFKIYFYMENNSKDIPIGTWNEIVVVAPGRTTEEDNLMLDGILNKAPSNPTNLSAYYVGNPTAKTYGDDFDVLINWTPSTSKNEDYYKLVIKDWTSGSAVDYKVFDADNEFFGSDVWVAGTLAGGTNNCTVKLPVGKKYEITLTAVNVIGESTAATRKTTEVTAVANHVAYGTENINLMKIAYDLNGGTLKTAADKVQVGGFVNKYFIFKNTEGFKIDAMSIKTAADEYPQLTKQNHPFLEWDEDGTKVESITAFGNRNLTANYNVLSVIDYTIDDSYGSINTTVEQANETVKNNVLKNVSPITITVINADDEPDPDVTHIKVCLLGLTPEKDIVIDKDVSDSKIVIDTQTVQSLDFRTYTVQVIATKADGKLYSNTFAITKQR